MATLPAKLLFDIIEDRIVDGIIAARDIQAGIDPNVYFEVEKELTSSIQQLKWPLVNVSFVSEGDNEITTQRKHQELDIVYDIELYTAVSHSSSGNADLLSAKRLFYLAAQVKEALTNLIETDLGFNPGVISKRQFPTFQRFKQFQSENENIMASGKFSFVVGASFEPKDYELLDLEEVKVDTSLYSYQIEY